MTPEQKSEIIKAASQLRSTLRELESFLNSADEAGVLNQVHYINLIGVNRAPVQHGTGMTTREAIIEADSQAKQLLWDTMQLVRQNRPVETATA